MANPWDNDPIVKPSAPSAQTTVMPWESDPIVTPAKPGMGETAARSAVQGLTFGFADESYGLTQGIASMLRGEGFRKGYDEGVAGFRARDKAGKEANPVTATVAEVAGGMGTGLGAMRAGATLMRQGMTLPQAIGAGAVEGAGYGAAYGAGNAEGGVDERLTGARNGARDGALIGAAVPAVARGISAGVGRAISPMTVPAERQATIDVLAREGVPVSAGQRTGSKALQYAESFLGDAPFAGGQATRAMEAQGEAFTDAAMRRIGAGGRATPDNLQASRDRIGASFNDLSSRNPMRADQQFARELGTTLSEYDRVLPTEQRQIVGNLATDIVDRIRANNGTLPGQDYQTIRSRLSRTAQSTRESDPQFSQAIRGLRDALDNNMNRSVSPEDAAAWQTARREYGNLRVLERAAAAGGENAAAGLVSPAQLRIASSLGAGNRSGYARGQGDFAELARAGNQIMTPLPNSGTGQRNMLSGMAGGGAVGAGSGAVDPVLAAAIAFGPSVLGRAGWGGPIQQWMANGTVGPNTRRVIEQRVRALTQGGAQSQSDRLPSPAR